MKEKNDFYTKILFNREILPDFWKIHISATLSNYPEILSIVQKYIESQSINYKYIDPLRTDYLFDIANSLTNPSQSGKFITIYPNNLDEAARILNHLAIMLKEMSGSEILTDRPYLASQVVFYRYGQHKPGQNGSLIINGPSGEQFEDSREPFFNLPDWISDPFQQEDSTYLTGSTLCKQYDVLGIIKKSNAGNVFFGINQKNHNKVIIKEARHHIYDTKEETRLHNRLNEFNYSRLFSDKYPDHYARPIQVVEERFSTFFIYEKSTAEVLVKFPAKKSPLIVKKPRKSMEIINSIIIDTLNDINSIHDNGYENIDISSANLAWNGKNVVWLDLDSFHSVQDNVSSWVKTPGFWLDYFIDDDQRVRDIRKVALLFMFLIGKQNVSVTRNYNVEKSILMLARWMNQLTIPIHNVFGAAYLLDHHNPEISVAKEMINSQTFEKLNTSNLEHVIQKLLYQEKVTLGDSQTLLLNATEAEVLEYVKYMINNGSLNKQSIGLAGLAGILWKLSKAKDSTKVFYSNLIMSNIKNREVFIHGKYMLRRENNDQSVISPYLKDGIAGLLLVVPNIKFIDFDTEKYLDSLTGAYAKSPGLWDGLSGIAYSLLTQKQLNKTYLDKVQVQLENVIDFFTLSNGSLLLNTYDTGNLDSNFSRGTLGFQFVQKMYIEKRKTIIWQQ